MIFVDLKARLDVERDLLENDTTMLTAEKEKLRKELDAKAAVLIKEKKEQELMKSKIKAMESKLLSGNNAGNSNMVERTNEQQRLLEKRKKDLADRRQAAKDAARILEETEEQGMELEKTYSSLQQEVDSKSKKLKKIFGKLQVSEQGRNTRNLDVTRPTKIKEIICNPK